VTKASYPVRVLFVLEQSAQVPRRWKPYEDASVVVGKVFAKHFAKRWRLAVRTARR